MIKGLPKLATLAMFAVLAVFALCAASASARPHGITITCGHKKCALPKHHHHGCNGKRKHRSCKHAQPRSVVAQSPSETAPTESEVPIPEAPEEKVEEQPFEVKGLEVYQLVHKELPAVPSSIWASAEVTYPYLDSVETVFYAEYGHFSKVYGGIVKPSILTPGRYSEYTPPCAEEMPSDGYDTAWVVVYDYTTHKFVESEHVRFNIAEPENVHIAHPAG
ncbi:MAG TPA: hypothetical protein VHA05_03975 [Candidatus Saccharimonadales bacterium]|nr:hypothetical protein [Candidatus Saccharimonadales bacterium]